MSNNPTHLVGQSRGLEKFIGVIIILVMVLLLQGLSFYGNRVLFHGSLDSRQADLVKISDIEVKKFALENKIKNETYKDSSEKRDWVNQVNNFASEIKKLSQSSESKLEAWYVRSFIANLTFAGVLLICSFFIFYPVIRYSFYISAFFSYFTSMFYGFTFLGNLGLFLTILVSLIVLIVVIILVSHKHLSSDSVLKSKKTKRKSA